MGSIIVTCFFLTWILMGILIDRIEDQSKRSKIAWEYTIMAVVVAAIILLLQ